MQQKPGITKQASFFHKTTCPVKQRSMPCKTTVNVLTNPRSTIGRPHALCAARVKGPPLELSTRRGRLSHVLLQRTLMQRASTFPQTCDNLLLCFHELVHPAGLGRGWCIMPCLPSVLGGGSGPNFSKWMTTPLWTFCTSDSSAPLIIFWLYTAYERPDREHHGFIFWLYATYKWPDQRTPCCFYILAAHHIRVTRSEHNLRSHIHTCAHKSTHTHLCSHTPMLTYTCTHTHVHSSILTYTHTHTFQNTCGLTSSDLTHDINGAVLSRWDVREVGDIRRNTARKTQNQAKDALIPPERFFGQFCARNHGVHGQVQLRTQWKMCSFIFLMHPWPWNNVEVTERHMDA